MSDAEKAAPTSELAMVRWTRAVAIFTLLLVLTSAITDVFIYLQLKIASDAQVDSRSQLRAWVTFQGATVLVTNDKDNKPAFYSIVPTFQNFGGTRTARFNGWTNIQFFEGDVPNNVDLTKPRLKIDTADTVIGPNSIYQLAPITFTANEVDRADKKESTLLMWGRAQWSDVFEPSVSHDISVCIVFTPTSKTTNGQVALQAVPYRTDCQFNR
jgi:hypothetical protein